MDKSVKELRKEERLEEAYDLAMSHLAEQPDNIWSKREVSWVLYDYIKKSIEEKNSSSFFERLEEMANLELPETEIMLAEHITWLYYKWFVMFMQPQEDQDVIYAAINRLFKHIFKIPLHRPSDAYSALLTVTHKSIKGFKDRVKYVNIINKLGFSYFSGKDFLPYKTENGNEIKSLVENIYNQYLKSLLELIDKEKYNSGTVRVDLADYVYRFINELTSIMNDHPEYIYLPYYKAKILISLEHYDEAKSILIQFVKKKSGDFWVWQLLGNAEIEDTYLKLSCYCKGLLCGGEEEKIVSLRENIAKMMIENGDLAEAKLEIERCISTRNKKEWKIDESLSQITQQEWFNTTEASKNNQKYYQSHSESAEVIIWGNDLTSILITYVNVDKRIANFITSDDRISYFRYDRLRKFKPQQGDVYNVTLDEFGCNGKPSKVSYFKLNTNKLKSSFYRVVEGGIKRKNNASFAFIDDVFIPQKLVLDNNLQDSETVSVGAFKSYNRKKDSISWVAFELISDCI